MARAVRAVCAATRPAVGRVLAALRVPAAIFTARLHAAIIFARAGRSVALASERARAERGGRQEGRQRESLDEHVAREAQEESGA